MKFHADCVTCLMGGALRKIEFMKDEGLKLEFTRRMCRIMDEIDPEYDSAPLVDARIVRLQRELLGFEEDFTEVKHRFNGFVLGFYDRLRERVQAAADPLMAAIQLSMAGNYIDFGVLGNVEPEAALKQLDEAAGRRVDPEEYANLRADLEAGGELVFLHDNCGEIVLDMLLIETIQGLYPGIKVVSVVRGGPVQNDATIVDAREIGLTDRVEVLENGLKDTAGTQLDQVFPEVRSRIENARLVIAKGQGNFESLIDCKRNVYFLFLSKCVHYTRWFGFERFSGILKNAQRMEF